MSEFNRTQELKRYGVWLLVAVTLAFSLQFNHVKTGALLDREGIRNAGALLSGFLHPDVSPDFLHRVVRLSFESLLVGILGTVLAVIIGTLLALVSIRVPDLPDPPSTPRGWPVLLGSWTRWLARFVLGCLRSIPEIVWAYAFVTVLGLGPGAAVLAIALTVGGSIGKLFSELGESVHPRIIEAFRAAGADRWSILLYGILPQVRRQWVAYALFRMECNIRTGTVLGVVGAGGLGSEIALSIRYLEFDKLATTLLAVLGFVIALEIVSSLLRRSDLRWSLAFAVAGGALSFYILDIPWLDLLRSRFLTGSAPLTFTITRDSLRHTLVLIFQTVTIAWAATMLAGILAFLLAPLSTGPLILHGYLQDSPHRAVWSRIAVQTLVAGAKFTLQVCRAMPELTLALLFVVWVGPGAFAGILAIAVHNIGVIGRLYTDVYEETETGPARALAAGGTGPLGVWLFGVIPQVVPRLVAFTLYRFEVNIRATVTVGFVGAGGFGDALYTAISLLQIADLIVLLAVMIVLVTGLDYLGDRLRHRILVGSTKRQSNEAEATTRTVLPMIAPENYGKATVFYSAVPNQTFHTASILEITSTGMVLSCPQGCPSGLIVQWIIHLPDSSEPLQGVSRVVGSVREGNGTCRYTLTLDTRAPNDVQRRLQEIAQRHSIPMQTSERTPEMWDAASDGRRRPFPRQELTT